MALLLSTESMLFVVALFLACFPKTSGLLAHARPRSLQLPRLGIDPARISISGFSSGGDFAVQFQVAFSKTITGSAIFAGQPFHCAVTRFPKDPLEPPNTSVPICEGCPDNKTLIWDHCKNHAEVVNVSMLVAIAERYESLGLIDELNNLRKARIYLYHGMFDQIYSETSVQRTLDFFLPFVSADQLFYENTIPSAHAWPTDQGGLPCGQSLGVIEDCGYDGPGAALQHIYDNLTAPAAAIDQMSLHLFDQSPFFGIDDNQTGLDASGYIYVPKSCKDGGKLCALHVALHGCRPYIHYELAVRTLSFNRWAETNDIVVLWPLLKPYGGSNATEQEDRGCYDVYAQTGHYYDTQYGVQMTAIRKMIEAVSGVQMTS
eukprot:gb/GFBE01050377.1/.p1 GENE.gb/GFBE01050377.1/~~gb/GFBE01050377.1/.p1  ORF type:complete len:375 (+),score=43.56 gb/GFBE01050377.1/:1-1125(+)